MRSPLVYLTVLVIATCGLVYELVAGTLASYVLGDSVTQFSTVIGVYLSALGRRLLPVEVRPARRWPGASSRSSWRWRWSAARRRRCCSSPSPTCPASSAPCSTAIVLLVGTLVGLEIPLILRILREAVDFKELVAKVLTFDYLGALVASLLFPILLVPAPRARAHVAAVRAR